MYYDTKLLLERSLLRFVFQRFSDTFFPRNERGQTPGQFNLLRKNGMSDDSEYQTFDRQTFRRPRIDGGEADIRTTGSY